MNRQRNRVKLSRWHAALTKQAWIDGTFLSNFGLRVSGLPSPATGNALDAAPTGAFPGAQLSVVFRRRFC
jgi:hypothetical protein